MDASAQPASVSPSDEWPSRGAAAGGAARAYRRAPSASSPRAVPQAIANAPRIGRSAPVSDSSPANSRPSSTSGGSCPLAARMPSAIGRSKRPDSFGRSAGARLTVMRRTGNSKPQFCSAARTRSRLSRTSVSGRPTIENDGRPFARWTSTVTSGAWPAAGARLRTTASDMVALLGAERAVEPPARGSVEVRAWPAWRVAGGTANLGLRMNDGRSRQAKAGQGDRGPPRRDRVPPGRNARRPPPGRVTLHRPRL